MLDSHHRQFFWTWLRRPLRVGAPIPSSSALARAMAAALPATWHGTVVELGGGTGIVTRALLARGVPEAQLVIVEREKKLHRLLFNLFPAVRVIRGDAEDLPALLPDRAEMPVAAIVSSLPLLSMPLPKRERILAAVAEVLPQGGSMLQYTYGPHAPVPLEMAAAYGLQGEPVARVWWNFPPARIWRFTKRAH